MKLPKFLIADSSELPEKIFILHTEYPRFIFDVGNEDLEWFDVPEEEEGVDLSAEIAALIEEAFEFFDREMEDYEED